MKRSRSSISTPTLQSVDPIDLRALSDELDLSDLMRRTVISTIDEWAETPLSASSSSNPFTPSPPPLPKNDEPLEDLVSEDMEHDSPNSPVRLWASIRRLWQAVFPGDSDDQHKQQILQTAYGNSSVISRTPRVPQPTRLVFEHPAQDPPKFDTPQTPKQPQPLFESPTQDAPKSHTPQTPKLPQPLFESPTQDVAKVETPQTPQQPPFLFQQSTQPAPKFVTAQIPQRPQPLFQQTTQPAAKFETPKNRQPLQPLFQESMQPVAKVETTNAGQPPQLLFQGPTETPAKVDIPHTRQLSQPLFEPSTPSAVKFENTYNGPPSQLLFQGSTQATSKDGTVRISQPSQPPPKLFTDTPQPKKPPRKPRVVTDFFDADIQEEDVTLDLPSDNELLDLCSRLTSPSPQSQRRRITGDPAVDRRLAHLESLRAQIRQRRENDKDADMIRQRRRQRLIEEQRKISSSLRVQRMSNVPRNVKLPVPTRRSRLARIKDARARGGVSSPTGIFEGATRFQG